MSTDTTPKKMPTEGLQSLAGSTDAEILSEEPSTSNPFCADGIQFKDPAIVAAVIGSVEHEMIALHVRRKDNGRKRFSKGMNPAMAKRLAAYLLAAVAFLQKGGKP